MTTYDVHAHCFPTELLDLLRTDGERFGIEVVRDQDGEEVLDLAGRMRIGPFPTGLSDEQARLAAMDEAGVDVQVLSHRTDLSAYALSGTQGPDYSRAFNEIMAEKVRRNPDRFLALGTAPLQNPVAAAEELEHAVRSLGMLGVEIASTVDGVPLDEAGLEPFWEVANSLRCLVLLHPYDPLRGVDLSENFLHNMVGRPAESTVAIARLIFSGIIERYPDLVVCLVHGGGFLPFQLGRMQKGFDNVPHAAAKHITISPQEIAGRFYYDSLVHTPEALRFLVDCIGAQQVVVGSDYPYPMRETQPVRAVRRADLGETATEQILGGNVERLLKDIRR